MSKIQTIMYLLVLLIVLFSMDMMFGNPLRETFIGSSIGTGVGVGSKLTYRPAVRKNTLNGNMGYPNTGFRAANIRPSFKRQSDDQPLHFSFPY
jgi:prepilin signal peptidase PulO-like enzyme (type II secretory pathway)